MMRWSVVLSAAAILVGCGGNGGAGDLTMQDNAFLPESLTVSAGSISIANDGTALHNFSIDGQGIDTDVQPGQTETVDLSLDAGGYPFECKYHPEMTGTLTIEQA